MLADCGEPPISDRNAKANFASVNGRDSTVPVETWNYKGQEPSIRHIGPMAQDFYSAFGVGEDDRHINMVDASGVSLAAIQKLHQVVEEQEAQITELEARLTGLEQAGRTNGSPPEPFSFGDHWMWLSLYQFWINSALRGKVEDLRSGGKVKRE